MAKPDKYPEWAKNNVIDPISGQNNKVEPDINRKNNGFGYKSPVPRQWLNWQFDNIAKWVEYLDTAATDSVASLPDYADSKGKSFLIDDGVNEPYIVISTGTKWVRISTQDL